MFPLLETAIGFVAVMLLLSLLVKSLTTLIKDHFDFYSDNLKYEVSRLLRNSLGVTLSQLQNNPAIVAKAPWIKDTDWSRVGDEFFNKENVDWLLKELGAAGPQLANLEGRLAVHAGKVSYMFEQRMKNLSIVVGLALCLFADINAFRIWRTLYANDQLRTTFASDVATKALLAEQESDRQASNNVNLESTTQALAAGGTANNRKTPPSDAGIESERQSLKKASDGFRNSLADFTQQVSFGVGHIWKDDVPRKRDLAIEFIGALLTGILVSVGAPYWHNLLESLGSLSQSKK
jgi:hypothetical protein